MKSYKVIEAEIEKLKREASSARKRELKSIIAGIRKQIALHGLTADELGLTGAGAGSPRKPGRATGSSKKPVVGAPKYRDPVSQKTWTGRGKPPLWIVGVKDRSAFLIGASTSAPESAAPAKAAKVVKAPKATRGAAAVKTTKPAGKRAKSAG